MKRAHLLFILLLGQDFQFEYEYKKYVWYFWERVYCAGKCMKLSDCTLHIVKGILDLVLYDSREQGWAIFSQANSEMTKGKSDIVLPVLDKYTEWAYEVDLPDKFGNLLDKHLRGPHTDHQRDSLMLPANADYIPNKVYCYQCSKMLDKYIMYHA